MATYTAEQYEAKLREFAQDQPEAVRLGLQRGSADLKAEIRKRYDARLKRRKGDLYNSIDVLSLKVSGTEIRASVGVGSVSRGGRRWSQVYKAVTHEKGATLKIPGGRPYVPTATGPVYVSYRAPNRDRFPKTMPYTVNIPPRPFVEPAKDAKLEAIKQMILDELIEAYKRA